MTHHGPATVSDQVHRMITIMCREKNNALGDIESKSQLHSKWLKEITEHGIGKILEAGCPPRKRVKISAIESDKENEPAINPNISVKDAALQINSPKALPLKEDLPIEVKIQNMKVKDLRESLRTRGLSTNGLKRELQDRLLLAIQNKCSIECEKDEIMSDAIISPSKDVEMTHVNNEGTSNVTEINSHSVGRQDAVAEKIIDGNIQETSEQGLTEGTECNHFSVNELRPVENLLKSTSPCNSPHFSAEVALPAFVQQEVSTILSPKKKQNTLGKIMKATTKLFSPKRNKEQMALKNDSPVPTKEADAFDNNKNPVAPMSEENNSFPGAAAHNELQKLSVSEEGVPSRDICHPLLPESTFSMPNIEKPIENAFTRKLSVCSTSSTSSSSSSAKIQAIRKLVREEQALKIKETHPIAANTTVFPNAVASAGYQSAVVKSTGVKPTSDKARFADIKEKVREQAKVNKVAALDNANNAIQVGAVASVNDNTSKALSANHLDDKKKLLSLQMREKAAAEALKKIEKVHSFKAEKNPSESVLMQIHPTFPVAAKTLEKIESPPNSPMDTYEMSDREGSSSSSSDDEDSEEEKAPSKAIPEWAHKERLQKALEKQFGINGQPRIDPDEVFGEVYTCDLSAIFGESKRFNKPRKETGDWKNDKITPHEQMVYKRAMGYE